MSFELWDIESGNLVGAFVIEEDALALVRATMEQYGRSSVSMWALANLEHDSVEAPAVEGDALAKRALVHSSAR